MTSPSLHVRLAETLKIMFNCVDCPIHFTSEWENGVRGRFYFREKCVRININQPFCMMVETICHELVHFKQWKFRKLNCLAKGHYWYDGQHYIDVSYHEQPWEHEANHYMKLMFSNFASKAPKSLVQEILDADGIVYA